MTKLFNCGIIFLTVLWMCLVHNGNGEFQYPIVSAIFIQYFEIGPESGIDGAILILARVQRLPVDHNCGFLGNQVCTVEYYFIAEFSQFS